MATITSIACGPQATNQGNTGQTMLINAAGGGLTGSTVARIGTRTVPVTVVSDTQVQCTVPGGCGVANVAVLTGSVLSNSLPFYYIPGPTLSDIEPVEGSAATPPPVTISGDNLLTANQASFDGTAVAVTPVGNTAALATPGPLPEVGASPWIQSVSVAARTAGGTGTLDGTFVAYDTPTITALAPASGTAFTEVVITGTAYVSNAITVTFDGVQAEFMAISDTQLLAYAPDGIAAGDVDVVVSTPGGASAAETFTYV